MELSEDDVLHILKLIDESKFDYFQLEVGELKITVSKGDPIPLGSPTTQSIAAPAPSSTVAAKPQSTASSSTPTAAKPAAIPEGMVPITAPLLGTFYVAPEPGAPPFVKVGDSIAEGQTLLIIEAMKVMNQIRSPRAGRISHILIADAEPVEYGAPMMVIE